ncbi:JmjC domain-containing protein [Streptomyces sp. H51]|uniref:JmjC domain-containing protein n=1 Tax=Streptomyces sp. H51 TaxID=3111770 RepID=UPI002D777712|nr:cupin domain-containing protein [Streptomyces sp. H51]
MKFGDLLHPVSASEFLGETLGRESRLIRGAHGRFEHLLPWDTINEILSHHRFSDNSQISLAKNHTAVCHDVFNPEISTFTVPGSTLRHRRVEAARLNDAVEHGATLQIKGIENLSDPIGRLADSIESEIRERVTVDAFICKGETPGFSAHWDSLDALAIQVHGSKKWALAAPTVRYPLPDGDAVSQLDRAPEHLEETVLGSGDLLYMPRGWWHRVTPAGGWSVHLTVAFHRRTAMDLAHWFVDTLSKDEFFRSDVPQRWESDQAVDAYLAQLVSSVQRHARQPDLLRRFLSSTEQVQPFRQVFHLPRVGAEDLEVAEAGRVSWQAPLAAVATEENGITVVAGGREYRYPASYGPVIDALVGGGTKAVAEVCRLVAPAGLTTDDVRTAVAEMALAGLIRVEGPSEDQG